jgi:hypothetical protein
VRVREGQRVRAGQVRADVTDRAPGSARHDVIEHLLLDVDEGELATGAQLGCHVQRLQAGAGADLQHPLARARLQQGVKAPTGEQRQREVEQVALRIRVRRLVAEHRGGNSGDARRQHSGRCDRAQ